MTTTTTTETVVVPQRERPSHRYPGYWVAGVVIAVAAALIIAALVKIIFPWLGDSQSSGPPASVSSAAAARPSPTPTVRAGPAAPAPLPPAQLADVLIIGSTRIPLVPIPCGDGSSTMSDAYVRLSECPDSVTFLGTASGPLASVRSVTGADVTWWDDNTSPPVLHSARVSGPADNASPATAYPVTFRLRNGDATTDFAGVTTDQPQPFTQPIDQSSDYTAALETLATEGYSLVRWGSWGDIGSVAQPPPTVLHVLVGFRVRPAPDGDAANDWVFFFLGAPGSTMLAQRDASSDSADVQILPRRSLTTATLRYFLYEPTDAADHPTAGFVDVVFTLAGNTLTASASPPTDDAAAPASRR